MLNVCSKCNKVANTAAGQVALRSHSVIERSWLSSGGDTCGQRGRAGTRCPSSTAQGTAAEPTGSVSVAPQRRQRRLVTAIYGVLRQSSYSKSASGVFISQRNAVGFAIDISLQQFRLEF